MQVSTSAALNIDMLSISYSPYVSLRHLLIWRVIVCLYFWAVLIGNFAYFRWPFLIIYLTMWTLIACTIYMSLATYSTYLYYQSTMHDRTDSAAKCQTWSKYAQIAQSISCAMSLTVVLAFWLLLYQYANFDDPFLVQVHGITAICTTIDLYLSGNTVQFKRTWYYLLIYAAVYSLFSLIWNFSTNWAIYPVFLDWVHYPLMVVITVVGVIGLSLLIHALLCWSHNKLLAKYANNEKAANVNMAHTTGEQQTSHCENGQTEQHNDETPPSQPTDVTASHDDAV